MEAMTVAIWLCALCLVKGQVIVPGQERGPCANEVARGQSVAGGAAPGKFVPQCTANGFYSAQQTHGSTGYSWCVDPENGQEIPGTRVGPGSSAQCSRCLTDKATALPPPGSAGAFVPKCNSAGTKYEVQQAHGSTGYSWCVDPENGQEIAGTKVGPGSSAQCPKCLTDKASANAAPGAYTPKCDSKGNFVVQQVHDSTGESWCVDPVTGQEISGSRVPPGVNAQCPKCLSDKANQGPPAPGSFTPKCDARGNFEVQQAHPSTGHSWCVDPATGQEIPGSRVSPGTSAQCPRCLTEKSSKLSVGAPPPPGTPEVKCDDKGLFALEQGSGSTGYRWCVDPATGQELPGSRVAPGSNFSCPKCIQEQNPGSSPKPPGSYTPQCDSSGNYKAEQSHPSTGYRWCVDPKSGVERPGSRIAPGESRPGWRC